MVSKILKFPFFAFLVGIFPIIALWNLNKTQVYSQDVYPAIGMSILFVIVIWVVCRIVFRSADRASIFSTLVFIFFFTFGHVYNLVQGKEIFGFSIGFLRLLLVYFVTTILLAVLFARIKKIPSDITLMLNVILTLLVFFNIIQIIRFETQTDRTRSHETAATEQTAKSTTDASDLPDIYYIILDSYSRQDVLKDLMNYDNSGFIDALRERGFYVADCANSNYDGTLASMASALNYSYLDLKANQTDEEVNSLTSTLINNKVRSDLAKLGYTFVTEKGFSSEDDINNSDIYLNYLQAAGVKDTIEQKQFTRMYFQTTVLRVFLELYAMDPVKYDFLPLWLINPETNDSVLGYASFWYNQTKYVFDKLEQFPSKEGNYFVYAHMNVPHGPFVFDANGNFSYTYNPENNAPYYLDQISYVNQRILKLIDKLISQSTVPPIIIVQGDHGAHVLTSGIDKHMILSAFYVPPAMQKDLYETITPVNTFRLVLRDVFHQQLDLLPDTLYVKFTNDLEPVPSTCLKP